MSLQDIIKKILADTQADLQVIETEAAEKKLSLDKKYAQLEADDQKELETKAAAALKSVDEKTASMARRENAKTLQQVRRELLDQALETFLASLLAADDKVYIDVCSKLIKALPFEKGTLAVPSEREALTRKLAPHFDIKITTKIKGGFVASNETTEIDSSFENLVHSEYRSELEMYLADQLKLI